MVKIFGDGADVDAMSKIADKVQGFTTNPSLMRKAGVKDYKAFAKLVLSVFPDHPLSLEVFADDLGDMERQAWEISGWGDNVYVKIPACNTKGASTASMVARLAASGVKVNVTAVMCYSQVDELIAAFNGPAILSIFAGRIADTGRNPVGVINHAIGRKRFPEHEILWASPRQVLDVYTADGLGCDIITCTPEIIAKLPLEGKNLMDYSRETVQMFYDDAKAAGYSL